MNVPVCAIVIAFNVVKIYEKYIIFLYLRYFPLLFVYFKFSHKFQHVTQVLELQIDFNYDLFTATPKHNFKNNFFSIFTILNLIENSKILQKNHTPKKALKF
jgi:hypothetical protein